MSRPLDPTRHRHSWERAPVPREDCEALLEPVADDGYSHAPRVCRSCQNKRYEAKIARTSQGARRKRRKALHSKKRRLRLRIERDQAELTAVLLELGAEAARQARA